MAASRSDCGPVRSVLSALCGTGPRAAVTAIAAACGGTLAEVGPQACGAALAVYLTWAAFWIVAFLCLAIIAVSAGLAGKGGDR